MANVDVSRLVTVDAVTFGRVPAGRAWRWTAIVYDSHGRPVDSRDAVGVDRDEIPIRLAEWVESFGLAATL